MRKYRSRDFFYCDLSVATYLVDRLPVVLVRWARPVGQQLQAPCTGFPPIRVVVLFICFSTLGYIRFVPLGSPS